MLETSNEIRMACLASIKTLNWHTTIAVKGVNMKHIIGNRIGLNFCGIILLQGYKIVGVSIKG